MIIDEHINTKPQVYRTSYTIIDRNTLRYKSTFIYRRCPTSDRTARAVSQSATSAHNAKSDVGLSFSPDLVRHAVKQLLRDPDSAQFDDAYVYDDRWLKGLSVTVVCGKVNAKTIFGGYAGMTRYVFVQSQNWAVLDGGPNDTKFTRMWTALCAGAHTSSVHVEGWMLSKL